MNDSKPNTAHIIIAWVFAVGTIGYMLPWAIAATRGKSNALPIAVLNFFVGWTFIGWVAALVMACGAHQQMAPSVTVQAGMFVQPPYPVPGYPGHPAQQLPTQPYADQSYPAQQYPPQALPGQRPGYDASQQYAPQVDQYGTQATPAYAQEVQPTAPFTADAEQAWDEPAATGDTPPKAV